MINKELVENKIEEIQGYFNELNSILEFETNEIISDNLKLRSIERLFQLIVDNSLDINIHLISGLEIKVPDDY